VYQLDSNTNNYLLRSIIDVLHIVRTITRDQFAVAINDVYYAALDDPTEGLNAISLQDIVTLICTTYRLISQPDINDNMTKFYILHRHRAFPPTCRLHMQIGGMPDIHPGCRRSHFRSHDGNYRHKSRPQLRQHGTRMARVETSPPNLSDLEQVEDPLDGCLFQNLRHSSHAGKQRSLRQPSHGQSRANRHDGQIT
jgi:hypothetical protein